MVNTALRLPKESQPLASESDNDLLVQFSLYRDENAFAELVRRHGPMVSGVCRNILQHAEDAEDAFQATFLVLARKAGSIRNGQALAGWLYRVAHRIALRSLDRKQKRRAQEKQANLQECNDQLKACQNEENRWLGEEVLKLPEKYRTPILLCYMQGQTNEEAAREMRCPTGTVKIRLMRAREMLRKRLTRRGLALSLTAVLAGWTQSLQAAVSPTLVESTTELGLQWAGGIELASLELKDSVRRLVRNWFNKSALAKLKVGCLVLLTLMLIVLTESFSQQARGNVIQQPSQQSPVPAKNSKEPKMEPTLPEGDVFAQAKL